MKLITTQLHEDKLWDYMVKNVTVKDTLLEKQKSVKNSQFAQPLFEFSGACAGCGETPYIKLITQLYGDRMMVANATGCSSIYGGSAPSTPYTSNAKGQGPAWANSLFEDNAEYGFGMSAAVAKIRERLADQLKAAMDSCPADLKTAIQNWLDNYDDGNTTREFTEKLIAELEKNKDLAVAKQVLPLKTYLVKKSVWVIGGDGWAYDIGFGGLDHVIASGQNINLLVLDTEVYSNTGGQSSKATPVAAVAKFAASGKRIRKKDLGLIAMSYGYVYVAQVAMGASQSQFLKAVREAEAYNGPSIIIAYSPCINHGLRTGMSKVQEQVKDAVAAGYWSMYRFNPDLQEQGQNPFILDSAEPDYSKFQDFLKTEVRYTTLLKSFPDEAEELFKAAEENAKYRHNMYKRYAEMNWAK